jgi:putative tricarboxylic transport membrane protein
MRVVDLMGGIGVLGLGAGITFFASRLPYTAEYGLGPGFMPLWIGMVLMGCAVIIIVQSLKRSTGSQKEFVTPKTRKVGFVFAALVVTFLFMRIFGLAVSLGLFTGVTMKTLGRHGWPLSALVTLVTAVAVYVIFGYLLDIPLPKGFLGI